MIGKVGLKVDSESGKAGSVTGKADFVLVRVGFALGKVDFVIERADSVIVMVVLLLKEQLLTALLIEREKAREHRMVMGCHLLAVLHTIGRAVIKVG